MCNHENWQYCRHKSSSSAIFFAAQCKECLSLVKLPQHHDRLFLRAIDIPADAVIHPIMEVDSDD